ncbi:MAG: ADP-glyceromanno-heptose 6-epimerase [Deltaproteobacteria bacterium]|nr:ADP-glyceromanno-heptose 6-epimerase [Deltaproteobacteria bacterium]
MYIVTGGAGFIGSVFARKLNIEGIDDILIVDELGSTERWKNLRNIRYLDFLHKDDFIDKVRNVKLSNPKAIIHMGACSSTTERDADYMMRNNYEYTKALCDYAIRTGVRFIYASSAATYGDGQHGYDDDLERLEKLVPLNVYGYSKHLFDLYAKRHGYFNNIVGLKFFNVYGPNEYHKEDMRSIALKSFQQISSMGQVKLFKSHRAGYTDGEQKRDFVYVKYCCDVMWWLLNNPSVNGLFNLGSGSARSWNDLVRAVFTAMKRPEAIQYIDMPHELRPQYQYFTEARMERLKAAGCPIISPSLEEGVKDYVCNYLTGGPNYA